MVASRPPPLSTSERPPAYAMVNRVYKSSLRPVVVVLSITIAIWTLIWAIEIFQDIQVEKDHDQNKLAVLSIVLGILYITTCAIELFGLFAASTQRLALVRIYAFASIAGSLAVVVAGFMRVVTHFIYKNNLIEECAEVVQGHDLVFRFGIWGPRVSDTLDANDAKQFCSDAWNHDSVSEIISLIVEIVLSAFFLIIAFSYYHQLLDPVASRHRAPSQQHIASSSTTNLPYNPGYPSHYNPPYLGYDAPPPGNPDPNNTNIYAPPPGPPPNFSSATRDIGDDMDGKPPGYGVGAGMTGYEVDRKEEEDVKDDPFADFEGVSRDGHHGESRDRLV